MKEFNTNEHNEHEEMPIDKTTTVQSASEQPGMENEPVQSSLEGQVVETKEEVSPATIDVQEDPSTEVEVHTKEQESAEHMDVETTSEAQATFGSDEVESSSSYDTQEETTAQTITGEEEPTQETLSTDSNKTSKDRKTTEPFMKRHRSAIMYSGCLLLAAVGGFGGTMLANQLGAGNGTVLYQSVEKSGSTTTQTSATSSKTVKEVAKEAANSVVEIKTESVSTADYFQQAVTSGAGSGVILSKDGYIVTNNHVISGANKITVTTKNGKTYEAKLIGTDSATDLAIIKIEATNLSPAILGSSSKLEVGDSAIAIGNPLGELGGTVTTGIISALDREITVDNQTMHLLQTNAAINPGNSGGGLFNDNGELIGIVNAKSSGTGVEGLGFAIPIDRAKDIITNLIENGYVKGRASLGVSLTEGNSRFSEAVQVYIAEISSGKAADKAGLKVGDQILKADGEDVNSVSDVKTAVNAHKAGETMTLTVLRDNETKTIKVTLGEAETTSTTTDSSTNNNNSNNNQSNDLEDILRGFTN